MVVKRTRLTQSSVCVSQFDLHKLLNSPKHPGNVTMHSPQPPTCRIFREENIREGEMMMWDYGGRDWTISWLTRSKKSTFVDGIGHAPPESATAWKMSPRSLAMCQNFLKKKALKMLFLYRPVEFDWERSCTEILNPHAILKLPRQRYSYFVNVLSVWTALMRQHIPQWRLLTVCFIILHKVMPWPRRVPFWIMRFRSLTFLAELAVLGRVVVQSQQTWGSAGVWWHRLLGWRSCLFCPSTAKYESKGRKTERKGGSCRLQGSKNLFNNTRQGGSKRKILVAKVAVRLKCQPPNWQRQRNALPCF